MTMAAHMTFYFQREMLLTRCVFRLTPDVGEQFVELGVGLV